MTTESSSAPASTSDAGSTIIDEDVEIHGAMKVKGGKNVVVRGKIIGEIESGGSITVDDCGMIHGSISAKSLVVSGRVETDQSVSVTGLLTMLSGGVLIASKISYGDLSHESGARMSGQLEPCARVEKEFRVERSVDRAPPVNVAPNARPLGGALGRSLGAILGQGAGAPVAVDKPTPVDGVASLPFHVDATQGVVERNFEPVQTQPEQNSLRELESVGA